MADSPKLRLIKKARASDANNFWKCCPLNREYLPESPCPEGTPPANKGGKTQDEPRCAWWINDKDSNYCFWRFIRSRSDENGVMRELVQSELAELFGFSNTKTHFVLKQAIEELTQALKDHGARELLAAVDEDGEIEQLFTTPTHQNIDDEPLE